MVGDGECPASLWNGPRVCGGQWRGLPKHSDELRVLLSDNPLDILSINETRLDDSVSDDEVYIPGYDIIRCDREHNGRFGGGVCIYVRSNINFSLCPDLSDIHLENLCIEIRKP